MNNLHWWASPLDLNDFSNLQRLDDYFGKNSEFHSAEPLTVRFRGTMVLEDEEGWLKGDNDLMIVTTFQFGKEPPIQRLHYMRDDTPLGWQGSFFHDIVLSVREFSAKILTLQVQVYDLDGVSEDLISSVRTISTSTAVAFPQIAPYAGALNFTVPALLKLVDNLDNHDRIIDQRIKLEIAGPNQGFRLLQPGYFVCFRKPVSQGLKLSNDLRVLKDDNSEFKDCSYAVLSITKDFHDEAEWEIDQKTAKLIAELNGKGQSGKTALEFLRETIDGYSNFKKLRRAKELQAKDNLSKAEQELLDELLNDQELSPYLSTN